VKRHPRLNPAWLEHFIDTEAAAARLVALLDRGDVPEVLKVDVRQFLKERDTRAAGKDPDEAAFPTMMSSRSAGTETSGQGSSACTSCCCRTGTGRFGRPSDARRWRT
jgi:hypothetical protein